MEQPLLKSNQEQDYSVPLFDSSSHGTTKLFDVSIRGESFKVYDLIDSLTPKWVSEDMNDHAYGMGDLIGLETIIDIGANTGIFSLYASRLFPDAMIYAYEPFQVNYDNLVKNIELNKAKNIIPIKMAVTGTGNNISMACPGNNSGAASQFHGINILTKSVPSITLNSLTESHPDSDLIKMDIESMEYESLWMFDHWERVKNLSVELHGLFPYPKLLWIDAVRKFADELGTKPILGKLWINNLEKI